MAKPTLTDTNPNVAGGGCLCSGPMKGPDTKGPFLIYTATDTDSNVSPTSVLCSGCPGGRAAIDAEAPIANDESVAI